MDILNTLTIFHAPILAASGAVPAEGTTGTWGGLIFYITIALGISFLCSVLEAVLLSTNATFVELSVENGKKSSKIMQALKADVERPISAILTLNTIAHTVGAAGAGAEAVGIFGSELFGVISAVLTLLILVFSEIIPKTIGATYWRQLNPFAAYTIRGMVFVLFPAVWLLEKTTQLLKSDDTPVLTTSRLEIAALARIGRSEGSLVEGESRILTNLLHLQNVSVREIMTPRTVLFGLQHDMTVKEVFDKHPTIPYSRIPIYEEDLDDIHGFILRYELLYHYARGEHNLKVSELKREMHVVPESNSVASVLAEFTSKQAHIFLTIDEFGGTSGIITMEDAIESLLGIEITDESDIVADLRKMAEQRFKRQTRLLAIAQAEDDGLNKLPEIEPDGTS